MRKTTWFIRATVVENSSSRVYWRSACPSKKRSSSFGEKTCSIATRAMTVTGDSVTKRSNIVEKHIAAASVQMGTNPCQETVYADSCTPSKGWVRATHRRDAGRPWRLHDTKCVARTLRCGNHCRAAQERPEAA